MNNQLIDSHIHYELYRQSEIRETISVSILMVIQIEILNSKHCGSLDAKWKCSYHDSCISRIGIRLFVVPYHSVTYSN